MSDEQRNIRPDVAESVTESLRICAREYMQAGAEVGEIAAPMILCGAELLITHLGVEEGTKSIQALLEQMNQQAGNIQ